MIPLGHHACRLLLGTISSPHFSLSATSACTVFASDDDLEVWLGAPNSLGVWLAFGRHCLYSARNLATWYLCPGRWRGDGGTCGFVAGGLVAWWCRVKFSRASRETLFVIGYQSPESETTPAGLICKSGHRQHTDASGNHGIRKPSGGVKWARHQVIRPLIFSSPLAASLTRRS